MFPWEFSERGDRFQRRCGFHGGAWRPPAAHLYGGFEESEHSELPYARAVASRYETEHQELIVTPQNLSNEIAAPGGVSG